MIKNDGPGTGGARPLPTQSESRVMPRDSALRAQTANSNFGNSGFAPSGFGNSIVPTNAPGMPQSVIGLLQALQHADSPDSVKLTLGVAQWQVLAGYLQTFTMEEGQALIEQGSKDTTVYFIESGALNVYHTDANAQAHVAIIGPGSCVGEGAFFSRMPRNATVQAANRCKLWSMTPMRFTELSNRHSAIALALVMSLGSVVARRLGNRPKRGAVT
jgi:CRP/FNR family transcriptional regulator, cyclic AMP receptor protein